MEHIYFCKETYKLGETLLCRMKDPLHNTLAFQVLVVEIASHDFCHRKAGDLILSNPFGEVQSDWTDDVSEWATLADKNHVYL